MPDRAIFVVRGDVLDSDSVRVDASNFRDRFSDWGRYGVSAFLAADDHEVDVLCATRLVRFATVAIFRSSDLINAGVEIATTFRPRTSRSATQISKS